MPSHDSLLLRDEFREQFAFTPEQQAEIDASRNGETVEQRDQRRTDSRTRFEEEMNVFAQGANEAIAAKQVADEALRQAGTEAVKAVGGAVKSVVVATPTFLKEFPLRTLAGGAADFTEKLGERTADLLGLVLDIPGMDAVVRRATAEVESSLGGPPVEDILAQGFAGPPPPSRSPEQTILDFPQPTTRGGRFARVLVEFIVALVPIGKLVQGAGLGVRAATVVGRAGRVARAGASITEGSVGFGLASGFLTEPGETRLANIIQEFPALENPVTAFLAADEDETAAEAILKSTFEGLAIGIPFETFAIPLKALKTYLRPSAQDGLGAARERIVAQTAASAEVERSIQAAGREVSAAAGKAERRVGGRRKGAEPLGEFSTLQRLDVSEVSVSAASEKPQGLFLSPSSVKSPQEAAGTVQTRFVATPKNVLDVSDVAPTPIRLEAVDSGATVRALRKLEPELFNELKGMRLRELKDVVAKRFPEIDATKFDPVDSQDVLEAIGGVVARRRGFDAIIDRDAALPEFSEFVALKASAIRSERRIAAERRLADTGRPGATRPLLPPKPGSAAGRSRSTMDASIRAIDEVAADATVAAISRVRGSTTDAAVLRAASEIKTRTLLKIRPGSTDITLAQERALMLREEVATAIGEIRSKAIQAAETRGETVSDAALVEIGQLRELHTAFAIRRQPLVSQGGRVMRVQQQSMLTPAMREKLAATTTERTMTAEQEKLFINAMGGRDELRRIAHETALLPNEDAVTAYWRELGQFGRAGERTRFVWYQGLLSGTALIKAAVGNPTYTATLAIRKAVAERLPSASVSLAPTRRPVTSQLTTEALPDFTVQGEAAVFTRALLDNIGGALQIGWRTFREPAFETVAAKSRFGGFRINPFTQDAARAAAAGQQNLARIFRTIASISELPTRGLVGFDDMTQVVVGSAEVQTRAFREATIRGLKGKEAEAFTKDFILNAPEVVTELATQMGLEAGLRQPPAAIIQGLITVMNNNVIGAFLAPFIRPGANQLKLLVEQSPLTLFSRSIRADLAAGGTRAQNVEAKVLVGLAFIFAGADLRSRGKITGRSQTGSFVLGDKQPAESSYIDKDGDWRPFGRDTLPGLTLTVGVDVWEHAQQLYDAENRTLTEKGVGIFAIAARIAADEIALRDVQRVLSIIYAGGSDLTAGDQLITVGERIGTTFTVPQGVKVISDLANPDREIRETTTMWDNVLNRAGVEGSFVERDLWGEPMTVKNPLYNAIPFAFTEENLTKDVEQELLAIGTVTGRFPVGPPRDTILGSGGHAIELDNRQKDRIKEIAGAVLRKRDRFAVIINAPGYPALPADQRAKLLQTENTAINTKARDMLLLEEFNAGDPTGLFEAAGAELLRRTGKSKTGAGAITAIPVLN